MQQDDSSNRQLNWANSTSNIGLEQQSKPKYWQTSSHNSPTSTRKKNSPCKHGRSKQIGLPRKKVKGAEVVLISPEREILKHVIRLQFSATNNKPEFEALLTWLSLVKALGAKDLIIQVDSQLIIGQAKGDYEAKEERIQKYLKIVQQLLQHFDSLDFVQIPRAKNVEVDFLARLASLDDYNAPSKLCVEIRGQPSIEGEQVLNIKE